MGFMIIFVFSGDLKHFCVLEISDFRTLSDGIKGILIKFSRVKDGNCAPVGTGHFF